MFEQPQWRLHRNNYEWRNRYHRFIHSRKGVCIKFLLKNTLSFPHVPQNSNALIVFKFKDYEEVYFHAQVRACKDLNCVRHIQI